MLDKSSFPQHRCYRFGPFRLDTMRQRLYKDNRPLELPRRLVRTLELLIEDRGKDLKKSYLMQQLWPDTVVEESNLTVIISRLRKVLGEDPEHKEYILTNPGRGYRFVAEVTEAAPDGPPEQAVQTSGPVAKNPVVPGWNFLQGYRSQLLLSLAMGLFFTLLLFGVYQWSQRQVIHSIAVLPFQSLGAERDDGYLGLGMADALITRLHHIRHVVVLPTAEVTKYQNTAQDPLALGKELHVVSVLEGTVQRAGDQVWLRVKLLRVKDGAVLWAAEYHGRLPDILTLQDQIADQATRALALKLDSAEQRSIHRHYTDSGEAYQLYIAARYYCGTDTTTRSALRGIDYFQQATAKDPRFALAYADLATCYLRLADSLEASQAMEFFDKAEAAAQRALEIDVNLPKAYLPLGRAKTYYEWDFPGAEAAFRRNVDLEPDDVAAHLDYARFLVSQGRFQEAEREARKATELDPLSWEADNVSSQVYFFGHRYREATNRWEKSWEIAPDEAAWYLGWIYASQGRQIPRIEDLVKAEATIPNRAILTAELAYVYALQGMKPLAARYLQKFSQNRDRVDDYDYEISLIYSALGDKDSAFQFLNRAREKRSFDIIFVKVDPRLESLRSDPRFNDLVRSIHLNP